MGFESDDRGKGNFSAWIRANCKSVSRHDVELLMSDESRHELLDELEIIMGQVASSRYRRGYEELILISSPITMTDRKIHDQNSSNDL